MHKPKTVTPVPIALVVSLAMVLAGCGGNGTSAPRQALLPAAASGIGGATAALDADISGEFSGTVNDSVFGAGRASIELSQYHQAAGGILTMTFGSTAFITPLSYGMNGGRLNGTDNYQISASSGVCSFTETATYKGGKLNGTYQAGNRCSNDHGTFTTKQTCRFSHSMGANPALKTCRF